MFFVLAERSLYVYVSSILDDARKVRLLEWLVQAPPERNPPFFKDLADELGVQDRTMRYWKADPAFRAEWEKQAKDAVGDPGHVQSVIEMLREGAVDRAESLASRTRAAEAYLKAVDAIRPPQIDMARKRAAELSDHELEALIREAAQVELQERAVR